MNDLYEVKTEDDCEGRTMRNLGIWKGKIADIALHLADKRYYQLYFTPFELRIPGKPTETSVKISGPWKIIETASEKRITAITRTAYGTFDAQVELSPEDIEEFHRKKALSKLTSQEKQLLGLV